MKLVEVIIILWCIGFTIAVCEGITHIIRFAL
jgi:hypothetical protein